MNCAISSLPAPLSPVMNTDASVRATLRAKSIARWNAGALPNTATLSPPPFSALPPPWGAGARLRGHGGGVSGAADEDLHLRACERLGEVVPGPGPERSQAGLHAR